jgi:multiple sugar transport system permease protein
LSGVIALFISLTFKYSLGSALKESYRLWIIYFIIIFLALLFFINPRKLTISKKRKIYEAIIGYTFLCPNIIGFLVFTSLPVIASLLLSFCEWDVISGIKGIRFVGLENFGKLLAIQFIGGARNLWDYFLFWKYFDANDSNFWQYMWNTIYLMGGIPFGMAGSLILAIFLNKHIKGRILFRTIYFLPTMCVPVAIFLLWRWLYNPDFGLINWLLNSIGIRGPNWLSSTNWAKPAIIITGLWMGIGGPSMILYLAGLQGIPRDLYEASEIEGANAWQKFVHITWPLLTPTTFFIFIMSIIGGFQGNFESAYMMTGGGPAGSTTAISFYIYNNAFRWFKMGYASAISWVLFVIVFVVTLINYKYGGKRVHYY